MTLAEEKYFTLVPNQLKELANKNANIASELHILNDKLQAIIDILAEK